MPPGKPKVIQDPVHGSIRITSIEDDILSLSAFNRLHYVNQTSMAFMVYPGLKHSRFNHSLGVMHLSSNIFVNSLKNSIYTEDFIRELLNEIKNIVESKEFLRELENIVGEVALPIRSSDEMYSKLCKYYRDHSEDLDTLFSYFIPVDCGENLVNEGTTPGGSQIRNTVCNKRLLSVVLVHQALRISALLHDLGHLPFSHDMERVLTHLYLEYKKKEDREPVEEWFISSLRKYLDIDAANGKKLHEMITCDLTNIVLRELARLSGRRRNPSKAATILLLKWLVSVILGCNQSVNGTNKFRTLKGIGSIISGTIDADRMDYILRDGLMAGILKSTADITRLINFFTLVKVRWKDGDYGYLFYPSIRSLNDYKTLLFDRYRMYKYVFAHHKVILYDSILERVVKMMMKKQIEYFNENAEEFDKFRRELLNVGDNLLSMVLALGNERDLDRIYIFVQLDDNWLLSLLRRKYLELELLKLSEKELDLTDEELYKLLEQMFTGGKNYRSLWKRDTDYIDFINRFLYSDEGKSALNDILAVIRSGVTLGYFDREKHRLLIRLLEDRGAEENRVGLSRDAEIFLTWLLFLWDYRREYYREFIYSLEESLREKFNDPYIFVATTLERLNIGIQSPLLARFRINGELRIEILPGDKLISNLMEYLRKERIFSTHFNVYFMHRESVGFRSELEEAISEFLYSEVNRINLEFFVNNIVRAPPLHLIVADDRLLIWLEGSEGKKALAESITRSLNYRLDIKRIAPVLIRRDGDLSLAGFIKIGPLTDGEEPFVKIEPNGSRENCLGMILDELREDTSTKRMKVKIENIEVLVYEIKERVGEVEVKKIYECLLERLK